MIVEEGKSDYVQLVYFNLFTFTDLSLRSPNPGSFLSMCTNNIILVRE